MAHRNCFGNVSDNLHSSDYISRKKAKTIYKNAVNLAKQGGVSHKKTSLGQNKGTYVGDIYIGKDKCLVGAKNYDSLLSVTNGKYLVSPNTLDVRSNQDLWTGSIYAMDMTGVTSIVAYPDGSGNTFSYPPDITANQTYPNNIPPDEQGLIVDPSYNIFYKADITQSARGVCYLKNERAYKQYLKCLPYTQAIAKTYLEVSNGYIGEYFYPKKFAFDCPDESWKLNILHCLNSSNSSSTSSSSSNRNYTTVPSINAIETNNFSWGAILNSTDIEHDGTVTVSTNGVEVGQPVTIRLNETDYTSNVSSNVLGPTDPYGMMPITTIFIAVVTIPATDLRELTDGQSYTVTANVSDTAGNAAAEFTSSSFLVATTSPTMTITTTTYGLKNGDTTSDATIALTFTSNETTIDFVVGDITVVNGSLTEFAGSGTTYTATFTPTLSAVCTINVGANTFTDVVGNNNSVSNTFTWYPGPGDLLPSN